jgi:flagellar protein FlaG
MDPILNSSAVSADPFRVADPTSVSDVAKSPDLAKAAGLDLNAVRILGASTAGTDSESPNTGSLAEKFGAFIDKLNEQLISKQISLNFRIDKESGSVVVKVIESESGKIIRQIPPDSILAMRGRLQEMTGIMLDTEI